MKRLMCAVVSFSLIAGMMPVGFAEQDLRASHDPLLDYYQKKVSEKAEEAGLDSDEEVRVIIQFKGPTAFDIVGKKEGASYEKELSKVSDGIETDQANFEKMLESKGVEIEVHENFTTLLNGVSATVKVSDLEAIENNPNVTKIRMVNTYSKPRTEMKSSGDLINLSKAWSYRGGRYNGKGMVVSVIDTGVDYTHKDMNLTSIADAKLNKEIVKAKKQSDNLKGQYFTDKVPYGYNFFDENTDVIDKADDSGPHGMHVAGTIAANGEIKGVAPEAQILAMKVFSNNPNYPSTYGDVIIEAIEESVKVGADAINMSLGDTARLQDLADLEQLAVQNAAEKGVLISISGGNSAFVSNGHLSDPDRHVPIVPTGLVDLGVVGAPGITPEALQVASIENKKIQTKVALITDADGNKVNEFKYVENATKLALNLFKEAPVGYVDCGLGIAKDFVGKDVEGKVALIKRGGATFEEKCKNAQLRGASAIILYNRAGEESPLAGMSGIDEIKIPIVGLGYSDGVILAENPTYKIAITAQDRESVNENDGRISDFSSWGPTSNFELKPEITAPGGDIYSTLNNNQYGSMSGTSMASPHVAGAQALVAKRLKDDYPNIEKLDFTRLAKVVMMNTAKPLVSKEFYNLERKERSYVSPKQQGAGVMDINAALVTQVIAYNKLDGKASVNLKEIKPGQSKSFTIELQNFSDTEKSYKISDQVITDVALDGAKYMDTCFLVNADGSRVKLDQSTDVIVVPAKGKAEVKFNIDVTKALVESSQKSILDTFENGGYVEGFVMFESVEDTEVTLSVPFLGFYGEWGKAAILDGLGYDDEKISSLYEEGGFYSISGDKLGLVGYDEEDNAHYDLKEIVIGAPPMGAASAVVNYEVRPKFSFLRNVKELEAGILDANGKEIVHLTSQKDIKKNYFDGSGPKVSEDRKWNWDCKVNGKTVPNGQYYYSLKVKIDFPNAAWQEYKWPIFVDHAIPDLNIFLMEKVDGKKILAVRGSTPYIYELEKPFKFKKVPIDPAMTKGVGAYFLVDAKTNKPFEYSSTGFFDITNLYKESKTDDGIFRFYPGIIGKNGVVKFFPEEIFETKVDQVVERGALQMESSGFDLATYKLRVENGKGSVVRPNIVLRYLNEKVKPVYKSVTNVTKDAFFLNDYNSNSIQLTTGGAVQAINNGNTTLNAVVPISTTFKDNLKALPVTSGAAINIINKTLSPDVLKDFKVNEDYYLFSTFVHVDDYDDYLEPKLAVEGDRLAPNIKILSPEFGSVYGGEGTPGVINEDYMTFEGSISDESGLEYLKVNDAPVKFVYNKVEQIWKFQADVLIREGRNRIRFEAKDLAGNTVDFRHEVYMDAQRPRLISTSGLDEIKYDGEQAYVDLRMVATDNMPMLRVQVNGNEVANIFNDFFSYGKFIDVAQKESAKFATEQPIRVNLQTGKNTIKVVLSDVGGNTEIKLLNVVVPEKPVDNGGSTGGTGDTGGTGGDTGSTGGTGNTGGTGDTGSTGGTTNTGDSGNKNETKDKTTNNNRSDSSVSSSSSSSSSSSTVVAPRQTQNSVLPTSNKIIVDKTNVSNGIVSLTVDQIREALKFSKSEGSSNQNLVIDLKTIQDKIVQVNVPTASLKGAATDIQLMSENWTLKLSVNDAILSKAGEQLNLKLVKGTESSVQVKNAEKIYESIKLTMGTADAMYQSGKGNKLNVSYDISKVGINKDFAVLAKVNADGTYTIVGHRVVGNEILASILPENEYVLMTRDVQFKDVQKHWSAKYVNAVASKGIINGFGNDQYAPEQTLTKAEFVTMLVKAMDYELSPKGSSFKDVKATDWSNAFVETAKANGVISETGKFNPNAKITRSEMAVMLANALKLQGEKTSMTSEELIQMVMSQKIMTVDQNGDFRGLATTNRGEAATVIYKILNRY